MGLRKGMCNNRRGRPAGKGNVIGASVKERLKEFAELEFDDVVKEFRALDGKDKVMAFERFLGYVIPKQQSVDTTVEIEATINAEYQALERLLLASSDEAIQRITDRVIELSNQKTQ